MQPQSTKNSYNGASKPINTNTQARANHSYGGSINRQQNFASSTPRNRHVQTAATIFPPLHPGMVMSQFNAAAYAAQRPPNLQQCQYAAQFYPQMYYPYYVPQLPQQPQQQQQNSNAGSIMGTMTLTPGSFVGAPSGNQSSLTYTAVTPSNSLINVSNTSAAQNLVLAPMPQNPTQVQSQLSYGLNAVANSTSMVNTAAPVSFAPTRMTFAAAALAGNSRMTPAPAAATSAMPPPQPQVKAKLRSHALQIIHPITNKNILQDLNNDKEISFPVTTSQTHIGESRMIKTCKSLELVQHKEITLDQGSFKALERNYKDASQQAEQLKIATITTQDACVEIIPNWEDQKSVSDETLPESTVKDKNLQERRISEESLKEQLEIDQSKNNSEIGGLEQNLMKINSEEKWQLSSKTPKEDEEVEPETFSELLGSKKSLRKIKLEPNSECDESHDNEHIPKPLMEKPLESKVTDEDFEDAQTCTDTSSLLEEQEAFNQATSCTDSEETDTELQQQESLYDSNNNRPIVADSGNIKQLPYNATVNLGTDSDRELERESVREDFVSDYNENRDLNSSPRQRKQYTRKQLMQLRQSKQSCRQPEVKNCSIYAPMNLMPAFAARGPKTGANLMTSARGGNHHNGGYINYQNNNYIKPNARANRGNNNGISTQSAGVSGLQHNRAKGKDLIYFNLCLKEDVKLNECDNAWKPRVLAKASNESASEEQPEKEELLKRVRGILNKLTPEKFEPLVEEIIKLNIDTLDKMEAVMNLVFEKAIDEPNFSLCYAKLCQRLISEVKASDERMATTTKTNLAYFRIALLDKTEREFTHHVTKINAKEEKLKPIREKYDKCQDAGEKIELEALLNEEERKIRRRSGGTVRFIGELFKISILSGKIIHSCIEALLKDPSNEDMLECLCKLLTTVGQKFEQTCLAPEDKRKYSLKSVIQRMQNIALKKENSKISSRIRFMLQDVIDLRKKRWQSTRNEAPKTMEQIEKEISNTMAIKTNTETLNSLKEVKRSVKSETSNMAKRLERMAAGSCEVRQNPSSSKGSDKWQLHSGKIGNTQALDSSKLVGLSNMDMNNKKMGGASLFQWKKLSTTPSTTTNSFAVLSNLEGHKATKYPNTEPERKRAGSQTKSLPNKSELAERKEGPKTHINSRNAQRMTRNPKSLNQNKHRNDIQTVDELTTPVITSKSPVMAVFKEPNNAEIKLIKSVITEMLENALNSKNIDSETVACFLNLPANLSCPLIYYILTDYLHLANVKPLSRRYLALVLNYLIANNYLTLEHFHLAYRNFTDLASDLIVDIPELWRYIFEFTGPLLVKNLITVNDLWPAQLKETCTAQIKQKFLKSLIVYCTQEVGPSFTRNLWQKHRMKWSDFLSETEIAHYIITNKFEFIENPLKSWTHMNNNKESPEIQQKRVMDHIEQLLKENTHPDFIIDYINGNITQITKNFIRNLTPVLTNYALKDHANNYSLDLGKFQNITLPILRRYLDSQEHFELECLDALHRFVENLENPPGLWESICAELYSAEVIAQETFTDWQNSKN